MHELQEKKIEACIHVKTFDPHRESDHVSSQDNKFIFFLMAAFLLG